MEAEREKVRQAERDRVAAVMQSIDAQRAAIARTVDSLSSTVEVLQGARDAAAEVRAGGTGGAGMLLRARP